MQSAKRKAFGSDPDSMSDIELWQQIVRCLHAARKKIGEANMSILASNTSLLNAIWCPA